ncbi:hypothetical protein GUJ93_ZPchr0316g2711 [Zizania palustris]|uniref:Uncharacterized protein n=1 Tax=Zizania palustris TaxID=103762 RepID=A0A8J5UUC1_ZIZPA|nr:hypothetical protein GUJ93_ZPchr0316g2711 [Zizania palustris]
MENNKRQSASLESLPKVMANVHDYFIYVASKMENLHQYVESLKTEYLHEHRRMVFSTPVSAPSSSSLFSTPTTPTLSSNIFGTSGSAQLSTPFGTVSTPTLGSTPAPSGFGSTTPSFASTPALGGTSLFSTPFGASGSSFGGTSQPCLYGAERESKAPGVRR